MSSSPSEEHLDGANGKQRKTIAITGSAGLIGSTLVHAFQEKGYTVKGFDREVPNSQHTNDSLTRFTSQTDKVDVAVNLSDCNACHGIFYGCDIVIHLAGDGNPKSDFMKSLLPNNIVSIYNVCEEAKRSKVKRVVFASSNHAQMYGFEQNNATKDDFVGKKIMDPPLTQVNDSYPTNPSSLYGVSKIFGEEVGKFYSRQEHAFEFVALRVGWIAYNNPKVHKGNPLNDYLEAMWLSKKDCVGFFIAAAEKPLPSNDPFFLGYAVSNNNSRIYNIARTVETLGYSPTDGN